MSGTRWTIGVLETQTPKTVSFNHQIIGTNWGNSISPPKCQRIFPKTSHLMRSWWILQFWFGCISVVKWRLPRDLLSKKKDHWKLCESKMDGQCSIVWMILFHYCMIYQPSVSSWECERNVMQGDISPQPLLNPFSKWSRHTDIQNLHNNNPHTNYIHISTRPILATDFSSSPRCKMTARPTGPSMANFIAKGPPPRQGGFPHPRRDFELKRCRKRMKRKKGLHDPYEML